MICKLVRQKIRELPNHQVVERLSAYLTEKEMKRCSPMQLCCTALLLAVDSLMQDCWEGTGTIWGHPQHAQPFVFTLTSALSTSATQRLVPCRMTTLLFKWVSWQRATRFSSAIGSSWQEPTGRWPASTKRDRIPSLILWQWCGRLQRRVHTSSNRHCCYFKAHYPVILKGKCGRRETQENQAECTTFCSYLAHCKHFAMECTSMLSARFPDLPIFASLAVPALSDLVEPESVTRCSSASIATDS